MNYANETETQITEAQEQGKKALEHGDVREVGNALWALSRAAPKIRDERVRTQSYRLYCRLQERLTELGERRRAGLDQEEVR